MERIGLSKDFRNTNQTQELETVPCRVFKTDVWGNNIRRHRTSTIGKREGIIRVRKGRVESQGSGEVFMR